MPSHTRFRTALSLTAASLLLTCAVPAAGAAHPRDATARVPAASGPGHSDDATLRGRIMKTLRHMSLEEKVGQLFVTYVYGDSADTAAPADVAANRRLHGVDNARQLIEKYHVGGIVYFAWTNNLKNPQQVAALSDGIQHSAAHHRTPVPLTVATDQEHGVVYRLGPPATQFPGAMALGAGRDAGDARTTGLIGGRELRAVGVNQNYAPIADVNVDPANPVIGVRSFGEDPALVASLTAAQIDGYEHAGVSATAKHFPGHGDTAVDSHTGLPVIDHSREEWERVDAPPFRAAIAAGVDSIMSAHIVVPSLDPSGEPATLSRPILTGLLREELGYDGVIVTDSLEMAGVRQKHTDAEIPVLALKAGADQLLMPPNTAVAYRAVLDAVADGELTEERIDASVYRILRMKFRQGLFENRYTNPSDVSALVGAPHHQAAAQAVSDRTTTLVRDDEDVLPLTPGNRRVLVTGWGATTTAALATALRDRGADTVERETGLSPTAARVEETARAARDQDLVVVATNKAGDHPGQRELVAALQSTGRLVIVIAVRDPYDIAALPGTRTYLATYSYAPVSLESAVRVLHGEIQPQGRLPVTIPGADGTGVLYPYGHGLTTAG
ncbi:glycoside hydrolase family 3 protein [Streptomyces sp. NPDC056405]|uniref:glycoside hydrolase family 3 protein n=1 Tax=Streptomyces sp. NPDC056405 TaxID=3345811 RepID=UPI0035D5B804